MTTTTRTDGSADHPATDPQAEVGRLRSTVLGGRGAGASTSEFLGHTRARLTVGGIPVPALREEVARDAAVARHDPDALALQVAGDRRRLAANFDVLRPHLRPQRLLGLAARPTARLRRRISIAVVLLVVLLWVRRLRRH